LYLVKAILNLVSFQYICIELYSTSLFVRILQSPKTRQSFFSFYNKRTTQLNSNVQRS